MNTLFTAVIFFLTDEILSVPTKITSIETPTPLVPIGIRSNYAVLQYSCCTKANFMKQSSQQHTDEMEKITKFEANEFMAEVKGFDLLPSNQTYVMALYGVVKHPPLTHLLKQKLAHAFLNVVKIASKDNAEGKLAFVVGEDNFAYNPVKKRYLFYKFCSKSLGKGPQSYLAVRTQFATESYREVFSKELYDSMMAKDEMSATETNELIEKLLKEVESVETDYTDSPKSKFKFFKDSKDHEKFMKLSAGNKATLTAKKETEEIKASIQDKNEVLIKMKGTKIIVVCIEVEDETKCLDWIDFAMNLDERNFVVDKSYFLSTTFETFEYWKKEQKHLLSYIYLIFTKKEQDGFLNFESDLLLGVPPSIYYCRNEKQNKHGLFREANSYEYVPFPKDLYEFALEGIEWKKRFEKGYGITKDSRCFEEGTEIFFTAAKHSQVIAYEDDENAENAKLFTAKDKQKAPFKKIHKAKDLSRFDVQFDEAQGLLSNAETKINTKKQTFSLFDLATQTKKESSLVKFEDQIKEVYQFTKNHCFSFNLHNLEGTKTKAIWDESKNFIDFYDPNPTPCFEFSKVVLEKIEPGSVIFHTQRSKANTDYKTTVYYFGAAAPFSLKLMKEIPSSGDLVNIQLWNQLKNWNAPAKTFDVVATDQENIVRVIRQNLDSCSFIVKWDGAEKDRKLYVDCTMISGGTSMASVAKVTDETASPIIKHLIVMEAIKLGRRVV